ncbi:MAG: hypothetical protein M3O82_05980 [Verrucomicrobiota bacterium]|nr:hypothetical protein [Verrucomicrobiota bacterium]
MDDASLRGVKLSRFKTCTLFAILAVVSFVGAPAIQKARADAAAARSIEEFHRLDNATDQILDSQRPA